MALTTEPRAPRPIAPSLTDIVCKRLRKARDEAGLTLAEVARRCRTTPQTIQRLETGKMTVSLEWLEKLCRALDIEPAELFDEGAAAIYDEIRKVRATARLLHAAGKNFLIDLETFTRDDE
ncbi:MAG TPA: helix-turn-helix transcriptional regulator [Alphaproteobacteria bacterium]|nr:helix-turn-helix transcriptional regulator [Alphaproteobacteria bacterium]